MKWKHYALRFFILTFIFNTGPALVLAQVGKVGINTVTPEAMLHVKDSSVVFTGQASLSGSPGLPPISGAGTRMMWYSDKAAFRGGTVTGTQWDRDSIGYYSMAMGLNTKAIGSRSTALGVGTTASGSNSVALGSSSTSSGINSMALGSSSTASGHNSTAFGASTLASGFGSTALGLYTDASGMASTAMGFQTISNSYASVALGRYNDTTSASPTSWISTDPLLIIGNGTSGGFRSNALVMLKDGRVCIGVSIPQNKLDIEGGLAVGSAYSGTINAPVNGAIIQGNLGVGTPDVVNTLDIGGRMAVGSNYSGTFLAPMNGAIFQGNIGIGTFAPLRRLHVSTGTSGAPAQSLAVAVLESSSNAYLNILTPADEESGILFALPSSSSHGGIIYNNSSLPGGMLFRTNGNITRMTITSAGFVGIGTSSPSEKLHVVGDICYTGSIAGCSDIRYKTNFNRLHDILPQLEKISAYSYFWKTDEYPDKEFTDEKQIGIIAQEVSEIFPEIVQTDDQGYLSVDYSRLSVILLAAIKEQQTEIKRLQGLEKRIALLEEIFISSQIKMEHVQKSVQNN